jgi:hypothetical protein
VAGAGRTSPALRRTAALMALASVLVVAGSAPTRAEPIDDEALYAQCRAMVRHAAEKYRNTPNVSVAIICDRPDGTAVDPKLWWPAPPARPAPTPAMTAGRTGCVTGPGRPVVGTALTTARATSSEPLIYEYRQLHDGETFSVFGAEALEFDPGDLAPGESYRWRARVDDTAEAAGSTEFFREPDDHELGWSPWCEFTVSPDAADYRRLGDVSLEALTELGLRPDRKYTVRLSGRQQRLLRAGTDVGRTHARMTLAGPRWTDLLVQLSSSAYLADEVAAEANEGEPAPPDGTAYRTLVDTISVRLGGPRHPELG